MAVSPGGDTKGLQLPDSQCDSGLDGELERQEPWALSLGLEPGTGTGTGAAPGPQCGASGEDSCDSAYASDLLETFSARCSLGSAGGQAPGPEAPFDPWAYLSEEGDTFLHLCIIHEAEALALAFIDQSPLEYLNWQNDLFQTPLHLAMYTRQTKIVRQLVLKGVDTELQDRNGNTALHLACQYSLEECVPVLTKPVTAKEHALFGFETPSPPGPRNLERHNWQGLTCLHLAVLYRNDVMVDYMLSSGARVNTQESTSGRTALHLAVELGELGLVTRLLRAGGEVDAPMYNGCTPLHLAVGRLDAGIAVALCQAGANPLLPNLEEDTPLDLASNNGNVLDLCPFDDVRLLGQPVV